MRLAITGCSGAVGGRVVLVVLKNGHSVVGMDNSAPSNVEFTNHPNFAFVQLDLRDYETTLEALRLANVEGIIHLAGIPRPIDYAVMAHNTNVVLNWNVLRSAAELGINRVAQASSVNVITLVYSLGPKLEYFPLDEDHPCLPDEPYGLSKTICELQAATIIRRYPSMRIASIRITHCTPTAYPFNPALEPPRRRNDLWAYVHRDSAAEAFLLAVAGGDGEWTGHEAFFITAPDTTQGEESMTLKEMFWPNVPIKEGNNLYGRKGFFDCSKAERLLGWVHRVPSE